MLLSAKHSLMILLSHMLESYIYAVTHVQICIHIYYIYTYIHIHIDFIVLTKIMKVQVRYLKFRNLIVCESQMNKFPTVYNMTPLSKKEDLGLLVGQGWGRWGTCMLFVGRQLFPCDRSKPSASP